MRLLVIGFLTSLLSSPAFANNKAIVEGVAASSNTVFVDTVAPRIDIGTNSYSGNVSNVGLFVTSNVVVSSVGKPANVVIFSTGSALFSGTVNIQKNLGVGPVAPKYALDISSSGGVVDARTNINILASFATTAVGQAGLLIDQGGSPHPFVFGLDNGGNAVILSSSSSPGTTTSLGIGTQDGSTNFAFTGLFSGTTPAGTSPPTFSANFSTQGWIKLGQFTSTTLDSTAGAPDDTGIMVYNTSIKAPCISTGTVNGAWAKMDGTTVCR